MSDKMILMQLATAQRQLGEAHNQAVQCIKQLFQIGVQTEQRTKLAYIVIEMRLKAIEDVLGIAEPTEKEVKAYIAIKQLGESSVSE